MRGSKSPNYKSIISTERPNFGKSSTIENDSDNSLGNKTGKAYQDLNIFINNDNIHNNSHNIHVHLYNFPENNRTIDVSTVEAGNYTKYTYDSPENDRIKQEHLDSVYETPKRVSFA